MIKLRIVRKTSLGGPPVSLRFDKQSLDDIGKIVGGGILDNIKSQQQADGSSLKMNAPSTREAKRKLGLPVLSLVFRQHRFTKGNGMSWKATANEAQNSVSVTPSNPELANLSRSLQQRGYQGWFGISAKAREAIKARVRKFIRDTVKKALLRRRIQKGRP